MSQAVATHSNQPEGQGLYALKLKTPSNVKTSTSPPTQRKKKTYCKKACVNCKLSHAGCSDERPCRRCTSLNLQCQDSERKRDIISSDPAKKRNSRKVKKSASSTFHCEPTDDKKLFGTQHPIFPSLNILMPLFASGVPPITAAVAANPLSYMHTLPSMAVMPSLPIDQPLNYKRATNAELLQAHPLVGDIHCASASSIDSGAYCGVPEQKASTSDTTPIPHRSSTSSSSISFSAESSGNRFSFSSSRGFHSEVKSTFASMQEKAVYMFQPKQQQQQFSGQQPPQLQLCSTDIDTYDPSTEGQARSTTTPATLRSASDEADVESSSEDFVDPVKELSNLLDGNQQRARRNKHSANINSTNNNSERIQQKRTREDLNVSRSPKRASEKRARHSDDHCTLAMLASVSQQLNASHLHHSSAGTGIHNNHTTDATTSAKPKFVSSIVPKQVARSDRRKSANVSGATHKTTQPRQQQRSQRAQQRRFNKQSQSLHKAEVTSDDRALKPPPSTSKSGNDIELALRRTAATSMSCRSESGRTIRIMNSMQFDAIIDAKTASLRGTSSANLGQRAKAQKSLDIAAAKMRSAKGRDRFGYQMQVLTDDFDYTDGLFTSDEEDGVTSDAHSDSDC